ncbi:MAG: selenium cofactor biosynthesis protein YqeC [Anaerolineales bacterium]
MELIHALRLKQMDAIPQVAFVGAGGKTTAMFQCARELTEPVLITSTSHLGANQLELADRHFFVDDTILDRLEENLPKGITLITGQMTKEKSRTLGVSNQQLNRIHFISEKWGAPLLIEADGSRRLPIKAPAAHEPPIPERVNTVVVVIGLSVIGKPLSEEWVFRPELFADITGLKAGESITPKAIVKAMTHPDGGMKNIPLNARRVALLNQVDTPELQSQAAMFSSKLYAEYNSVILGSLAPKNSTQQLQNKIHAVYQPIAAVILAAGGSQRFGSPKQLLDWHGKPLIWHVAHKALNSGMDPVVVVCGRDRAEIGLALSDLPVEFVENPDWQRGQGTSVKLGTLAVSARCAGIVFLLADQPQIPIALLHALLDVHARKLSPIIGPMIDGQRANPVLFDQVTFKDLSALSGEIGGRKLFSKYGVEWIPWYDPTALLDIDTPADYARLQELSQ